METFPPIRLLRNKYGNTRLWAVVKLVILSFLGRLFPSPSLETVTESRFLTRKHHDRDLAGNYRFGAAAVVAKPKAVFAGEFSKSIPQIFIGGFFCGS